MLIFFFPFEALRRQRWSSGSGDPAFPFAFAFGRGLVRPLSVVREGGGREGGGRGEGGGRVVCDTIEDKRVDQKGDYKHKDFLRPKDAIDLHVNQELRKGKIM